MQEVRRNHSLFRYLREFFSRLLGFRQSRVFFGVRLHAARVHEIDEPFETEKQLFRKALAVFGDLRARRFMFVGVRGYPSRTAVGGLLLLEKCASIVKRSRMTTPQEQASGVRERFEISVPANCLAVASGA